MRHQWRLLLLRAQNRCFNRISNHFSHPHPQLQVLLNPNLHSIRSLSSLLHFHRTLPVSVPSLNPIARSFSSEPALAQSESECVVIADIFLKRRHFDDIKKELDSNCVLINHDMVLGVLGKLDSKPDVAKRFFDWVLGSDPERLSSKSYNMILGILGINGFVDEFWELIDVMKKKGYGVSKGVRDKVLECFEKGGMKDHAQKLKALFALGSVDNSPEKICSRVCKIVRHNVWDDDVERQIQDMNIAFSSDMVKSILESIGTEPSKALIFFRWLEESAKFKHDGCTYNAMARVLKREDTIDRFWKLVDDMRNSGFEMEPETFAKVLGRFCKRRMINDAVRLYEFAISGANKPSPECCTFLLKKIVVCKQFDMNLFSRVAKAYTGSGNLLTDSMVDAILKSLTSVGRLGECNMILKELKENGFVPIGNLQSRIAFQLSAAGNKEEAQEFMNSIYASGSNPEHKSWESLVEGHCVAGNLDKAFDSFKEIIEKEGVNSAGYTFDLLMSSYCQMNRAIDACKILCQVVDEKELKPWHSTYKLLLTKLLGRAGFTEGLSILGLMRTHGYPPFSDPFIEHVSKCGSGDDAVLFLKAVTSKSFPSTSVFLRMFDAFFKHGRHEEAQNFLSKCPRYIRNHADILNLFSSLNSGEGASSAMLAA